MKSVHLLLYDQTCSWFCKFHHRDVSDFAENVETRILFREVLSYKVELPFVPSKEFQMHMKSDHRIVGLLDSFIFNFIKNISKPVEFYEASTHQSISFPVPGAYETSQSKLGTLIFEAIITYHTLHISA